MANSAGSSKTDTAVKLVLIFFISLLSFSVGTFVGEQFTKQEYKQASTTEEYGNIATGETEEHEEEASVSEEEVADLTEEFLEEEKKGTETTKMETTEAENGYSHYKTSDKTEKKEEPKREVAEAKTTETVKPVSKEADRVAHGNAPVKDPAKRKVANVLPSVASSALGKYTVQVASYATETEATGHAARLKSKGLHAFFIPASIKGKTWYRVSVGLFPSQSSAVKYQKELQAQAGVTSSIVQKIVK